jgi:hypothetical protein
MVTQHDSLTNVQRVVTKMMTFQFNKKERVSFDIEEKNKTVAFVRTPVQEEAPWGYVSHLQIYFLGSSSHVCDYANICKNDKS